MKKTHYFHYAILLIVSSVLCSTQLRSQVTKEAYERAESLRDIFSNKMLYGNIQPEWIGESNNFWYQTQTKNGTEFFIVESDKKTVKAAFDHKKLASCLGEQLEQELKPYGLRFRQLVFTEDLSKASFVVGNYHWNYNIKKNKLEKGAQVQPRNRSFRNWSESRNELEAEPIVSPDSVWEAFIQDHNLWIKKRDKGLPQRLSIDGVPGNYYSSYVHWSPDSKKIVAIKFRPTWTRKVHYVESSPDDQVQPKHEEIEYTKPGDELPHRIPTLFLVDEKKQLPASDELIPDQFSLGRFNWRDDSRAFTFEYNERGHQLYRIIELDASTGEYKTLIEEASPTFIHYSGKRYRNDIDDGKRIIWASERDGWNHLYLYDGVSGKVINQITKGNWLVREVLFVDEENKQITFSASGKEPDIDPYLVHVYRINFDGSGLIKLTEGNGNHTVTFSKDNSLFVDTWSRIDQPPKSVLRKVSDGSIVMNVGDADISALEETGWQMPEVFSAKGRDGATDIWGIIIRPTDFDPAKSYPVIEYIYAGPHSSHVPKSFRPYSSMQAMAEMGFILVQIDGMGTSNRSKAFHDVCWQNLGDAGFPDRILWMQAAAEKYSYMDLDRVGIYGTSAGGQNSMGALLFHPDFYKVAVSSCGCHDNRMDKIWWNEQWMGYPIGDHYSASSNVDNAHKLEGKLLLILGEMDKNVDPSSTMQVVDALIKANKDFDFIYVPGLGHSGGGKYGDRRRIDFFINHLQSKTTPDWNKGE